MKGYEMGTVVTRKQRARLANLLLAHGFDNLFEFWSELVREDETTDMETAKRICEGWLAQVIELASRD
jgi:hypothetical protein